MLSRDKQVRNTYPVSVEAQVDEEVGQRRGEVGVLEVKVAEQVEHVTELLRELRGVAAHVHVLFVVVEAVRDVGAVAQSQEDLLLPLVQLELVRHQRHEPLEQRLRV